MFELLCFEICALAILVILLFALEFRNKISDKAGKKLVKIIIVSILSVSSNIISYIIDGKQAYIVPGYVLTGIYCILRPVAFYLYADYIVEITGYRHAAQSLGRKVLHQIPIALSVLAVLFDPLTKWFYYYDETGLYFEGDYYLWLFLMPAIYGLYAINCIIKCVPLTGKVKSLSLSSSVIFTLLAILYQYFNPNTVIETLAFSLSILFIILFIDNPKDKVEMNSGLLSMDEYTRELQLAFFTNRPIDIIHVNITNFKMIEETLKYNNVSVFEKEAGEIIRSVVSNEKDEIYAFNLKSGRFRLILDNNNNDRTLNVANKLIEKFNTEVNVNDTLVFVEASIIITQCPKQINIMEDFVAYGKIEHFFEKPGTVVFTEDVINTKEYKKHISIGRRLEQGIINNKFEVAYEPMYNVATDCYDEVDTILRLRDDDFNYIEKNELLSAMERNGLASRIGRQYISDVCEFIASDNFKGTGIKTVNIRLSTAMCLQKQFAQRLYSTISSYDVDPKLICFEIDESSASDDQKTYEENVNLLHDKGFGFSLDNYGSGYTNIITLSTVPLETIRFEKSFASDWNNEKIRSIFVNTVDMVKAIGKKVIIEDVNSKEHAEIRKKMGCDYLKGTIFSRPMLKDRLLSFYKELNEAK